MERSLRFNELFSAMSTNFTIRTSPRPYDDEWSQTRPIVLIWPTIEPEDCSDEDMDEGEDTFQEEQQDAQNENNS